MSAYVDFLAQAVLFGVGTGAAIRLLLLALF